MYDTIIIGSGPAGLSAAVYAARAALKALVIEKVYGDCGQIAESERVDNYLGLYGENGFELGEKFRSHAEALGAAFYEGEVSAIERTSDGYRIRITDGGDFLTKTVVYAAGASHCRLNIKGEKSLSGKGVSYCALCDGAFCKDKAVAVIGGGDTALGEALLLSKTAEKVYLVHRRDTFRANKRTQAEVFKTANIEPITSAIPTEIVGENRVEALVIEQAGVAKTLSVSGVFVAVGRVPNSDLLKGLADLTSNGYVIAGEEGITSAEGIFVAGDVRSKSLRQVITAASDGANCTLSVERYLSEKSAE